MASAGVLAEGSLEMAVCRAARLPVVAEVAGLFAWARPGDRMLVAAEGGVGAVCVNPPATSVARFRAGR